MNDFFCDAQLSDNISKTPEGFLVCSDVPITRAGDMYYGREEIPSMGQGSKPYITLTRSLADIHSDETAASFEGKPVTIGHPIDAMGNDVFVGPDNWKNYSVGVMQNVRPGTGDNYDKLLADLLITDSEAISLITDKTLRQVSCGYSYDLVIKDDDTGEQTNIIGNHLALVEEGRAGPSCAIFDSKKTGVFMSFKEKILGAFSKAYDEVSPDESKEEKSSEDAKDSKSIDIAPLNEKIIALEKTVSELVKSLKSKDENNEQAEDDAKAEEAYEDGEKADEAKADEVDQETVSKAEVLAPGIEPSENIKTESLDRCYKSAFGKKIIDSILGGQSYDKADKNILFHAAAALISAERKNGLITSADSVKQNRNVKVTPEILNRMNQEFWANKKN